MATSSSSSSSSSYSDSRSDSSVSPSRHRRASRNHRRKNDLKDRKKSQSSMKRSFKSRSFSSSESDRCKSDRSDSEIAGFNSSKRHKRSIKSKKKQLLDERHRGPVKLSKFLGCDKDNKVRMSAISGKKILLKVDKTKEDRLAESKRNELLKFLNASYD